MVFVYYCVMYALWYHVLPLLIFYFIVLHYNVLYVIVLYFLMCCTYYYLFKNITQGLSGTLTETIFVYLHICLFVFCVFVFACQITGNIVFLCICVFVFLYLQIPYSGTLFLSSSLLHLFKNVAHFVPICNFDQRCICVFVFA